MSNAFHVLTAVLVVLKLIGVITISWWLVVLPTLFVLGLSLLIVACVFGLTLVSAWAATR